MNFGSGMNGDVINAHSYHRNRTTHSLFGPGRNVAIVGTLQLQRQSNVNERANTALTYSGSHYSIRQ